MPTLQIHSLPTDLYEYFQTRARLKNSSLEEQIIAVLYQFQQQEETPRQRQARILADIYQFNLTQQSITLYFSVTDKLTETTVKQFRQYKNAILKQIQGRVTHHV